MKRKTIYTELGEFNVVPYSGTNQAGYEPFGNRVLVLPDQPAETTSGGIYLPEDTKEKIGAAAETGILVALGDDAWRWNSDRTRPFEGRRPQAGERVYFERYSGQLLHGDDGSVYRVMDDNCIAALRSAA